MNTQKINKLESAQSNAKEITLPTSTNPRIVQLDAILNRSSFIWGREQIQASNNN